MRACPRTRLLTPLHLLAIALCCVPLGACLGLDTGPGLTFDQDIVAEGEALADFVRAQGNTAAIAISGRIVGKLPCDQLAVDVEERGSTIDFTVTLDADRNACNGIAPTTWAYVANVVNLDPGEKNVQVLYRFRGTDGVAGVRLDTTVTVR